MQSLLTKIIFFYRRYLSIFLPPSCRFLPSCSEYTATAINEHGCIKGGAMGFMRICRCHPFHVGGFDPVPESKEKKD